MPPYATDLALLLVALVVGFTSGRGLLTALREGRVTIGKGQVVLKSERPGTYWSHVVFEGLMVLAAVVALGILAVRLPGEF